MFRFNIDEFAMTFFLNFNSTAGHKKHHYSGFYFYCRCTFF